MNADQRDAVSGTVSGDASETASGNISQTASGTVSGNTSGNISGTASGNEGVSHPVSLLDAYVDGELTAREASDVARHLSACPVCRRYADDALAIRAAFPRAEDTVVPAGFAARILARLPEQETPDTVSDTLPDALPDAVPTALPNALPNAVSGNGTASPEEYGTASRQQSRWWSQWRTIRQSGSRRQWGGVLVPLAACLAVVVLVQNTVRRDAGDTLSGGAVMESAAAATNGDAAVTADMDTSVTADMDAGGAASFGAYTVFSSDAGEAEDAWDENTPSDTMDALDEWEQASRMTQEAVQGIGEGRTTQTASQAVGKNGSAKTAPESPEALPSSDSRARNETEEYEEYEMYRFPATEEDALEEYAPLYKTEFQETAVPDARGTGGEIPDEGITGGEIPDEGITDAEIPSGGSTGGGIPGEGIQSEGIPDVELFLLPADAAPLLDGFPVLSKAESGRWYALTEAEYADLSAALETAGLSAVGLDRSALPDTVPVDTLQEAEEQAEQWAEQSGQVSPAALVWLETDG